MSEERRKIGSYETIRLLGKVGMSEVHEVENPRFGSHHALKLFTYEKDDPEAKERFTVEGKLLRWPENYMQVGSDEATYWLQERGLERLRELSER